jgi:hypothetical protein
MNDKIQPILATAATGATWVVNADAACGLIVTLLTLAWWVRLWIKNPGIKPPNYYRKPDEKDQKP